MGADVNCVGSNNDTALHVASINGEVHVVRFLLEKGAKIDQKVRMNNFHNFVPLPSRESIQNV